MLNLAKLRKYRGFRRYRKARISCKSGVKGYFIARSNLVWFGIRDVCDFWDIKTNDIINFLGVNFYFTKHLMNKL